MRMVVAAIVILTLTACAHNEPAKPVVTTVYMKVKEPCISHRPVKPVYKFGKGDEPSDKEMAIILTTDLEAAQQYGNAWEAAATGCVIEQPFQ